MSALLMIINPETKEAYRVGDDPRTSGPLFFTSRESLEAYAAAEGIAAFEVYELPAGVLERMKGKPYWLDGKPGG
jgi:hypothetical protein